MISNEKIIWHFLQTRGFNDYAIAGIMGNMKAESGLRSNNLQSTYEKAFNLTDDEYTEKVDKNTYTNFVHDSAGYGLCQWTYWSRKASLYNWCKTNKCSIGDIYMQLGFFYSELVGTYAKLHKELLNAKSVREASDLVLLKYEKPKDQSEKVRVKRAEYGQKFYDKYSSKSETGNNNDSETITSLSIEEVAKEVIAGKYGNGVTRKNNLEKLGYNYSEVQSLVNKILKGEQK